MALEGRNNRVGGRVQGKRRSSHIIIFNHQSISVDDIEAVSAALASNFITQGPLVHKFERRVAEVAGFPHAVAVCHGTCALGLALRLLVSHLSPVETHHTRQSMVCFHGGAPYNGVLNALSIAGAMPCWFQHHLGRPEHIGVVTSWFGETPMFPPGPSPWVFDAARAFGNPSIGNKNVQIAILSFHPLKTICTGEGGMILVHRKSDADTLSEWANQGIGNFRMTETQAALGISQLTRLDEFVARRREIGRMYVDAGICEDYGEDCVWNVAPMYVPEPGATVAYFQEHGIDARLPKPLSKDRARTSFVMLPIFPLLSDNDAGKIIKVAGEVRKRWPRS